MNTLTKILLFVLLAENTLVGYYMFIHDDVFSYPQPTGNESFIWSYQTLIAGFLALFAGGFVIASTLITLNTHQTDRALDYKKFRSKFESELLYLALSIEDTVNLMEKQNNNKHDLLTLSSMGVFTEYEVFSNKHVYDHFFPYLYSLIEDEVRLLAFLEFHILKQNRYIDGLKTLAKHRPDYVIPAPSETNLKNTRIIAEAAHTLRNSLLKKENADQELVAFLNEYNVKRVW